MNLPKITFLVLIFIVISSGYYLISGGIKIDNPIAKIATKPTPTFIPSPTIKPTSSPSASDYYWQGFDIWVKTKDYLRAEKLYLQSLNIDPNYAPALSSYGYIRGAFYGEYQLAEKYLTQAMDIDPNWAYAPYNLALLYSIRSVDEHSRELSQKSLDWFRFTLDKFSTHPDYEWFNQHYQAALDYHRQNFGE